MGSPFGTTNLSFRQDYAPLIRRQWQRVDMTVPRLSLQNIFYRLYNKSIIWEYQKFRGTTLRDGRPATPDLAELTEEFNFNFPYLNWRLLMRSYITKLKQRVRATRLERRVRNTVARGYVNQQSSPTEFYKRLAVGV